MNNTQLKHIAFGCFLVSLIFFFVGWERYQANAADIAALNQLNQAGQNSLMGHALTGLFGAAPTQLTPGIPSITVYMIFFGVLTALVGVYLLFQRKNAQV